MSKLILIRHGQSEYNKRGLWTGWTDVSLSPEGVVEAQQAGECLKNLSVEQAFTSNLKRAQETLKEILKVLAFDNLPTSLTSALNERNYGIYTGKNKWDIQKEVGEENFQKIRREWSFPIENGESLKDVYERVVPYYQKEILPLLEKGENVLVVFHGNPIRALVKYLEKIDDDKIASLEIGTGEVYIYDIDASGNVTGKEIRSVNPNTGKI